MTNKKFHGINGVLDGLISTPNEPQQQESTPAKPQRRPSGTPAKQGRPFSNGKKQNRVKKEKVTVRVAPDLAETYRQWSWNARCSLSELIETAMREYHARHNKR